jgi:hypothetical protein
VSMNATEVVAAWESHVAGMPLSHAVTLAYNPAHGVAASSCWHIHDGHRVMATSRPSRYGSMHGGQIGIDQMRSDLRRFHRNVDRRIFGTRFHKGGRKSTFVAVAEHMDSNVHLHLAWHCPVIHGEEHARLVEAVQKFWPDVAPNGTSVVEPIHDAAGWAAYMLKNVRSANDTNRIIISGEAYLSHFGR